MFEDIKTYLSRGSVINTIEVADLNGQPYYKLTKAKITKGELFIIEVFKSNSLQPIKDKVSDKEPVHLILNTSDILTKLVPEVSSSSDAIVNRAFPNIDFSQFNYEILKQTSSSIVCAGRTQVLSKFLDSFREINIYISSISLGICRINSVAAILENRELQLTNSVLNLSDSKEIQSKQSRVDSQLVTYTIGDIQVSNEYLLSFSNILSLYGSSSGVSSNYEDLNTALNSDLYNRRFYHYTLRGIIGFLLVILLANFFVFHHYYTQNSTLNSSNNIGSDDIKSVTQLKEIVTKKEAQVKTLYASSQSKTAVVLDQLANAVPPEIKLSIMTYQPLIGSIKKTQLIDYSTNAILIEGDTNDKDVFNEWIDTIESNKYFSELEIVEFSYVSNNLSTFSIRITLSDETKY